jgi:acetyl esterase/lipase
MVAGPIAPWSMPFYGLLESVAGLRPRPKWATYEPVRFDGFDAEWTRAEKATEDGVVLYFHGGAFLMCGIATHRPAVAAISRASGMPVLSVAYRQLPKVPLIGSVADCLTSYRYLLSQGFAPEQIVFAGDSAGGHLAFATALQAVAEGLPTPAGIVALSPWLDLDCETKLSHPNSKRDAYAPVHRLPKLVHMLTDGVVPTDPLLSPVNHDLTAMPPSLLIAAEGEMLRCDSELMADRLAAAGVPVTLQLWDGQVHAFAAMYGVVPEAGRAIREIGSFVRRTVGADVATERKAS